MSGPSKADTRRDGPGGIVVFAYSDIGYECLELLIQRGENIRLVFTHEDEPGETRWFRSVAELARLHALTVRFDEPKRDSDAAALIAATAPDLIFSFYYRRMIPMTVLGAARLGAFNLHGSLLPRYRGKAPVNWAVLHGEDRIGVTLHHMAARADTGDIVDQDGVAVGPDETAFEVMKRLVPMARRVLARQLDALKAGTAPRRPQDESLATYFSGRRPEDGRIDWHQPAARINNLVRAVAPPYPGAFAFNAGRKLMVWRARLAAGNGVPGTVLSAAPLIVAAGEGTLEILEAAWADSPADPPAGRIDLKPGEVLG
jgi:methionyl-tRNA formyltransferase